MLHTVLKIIVTLIFFVHDIIILIIHITTKFASIMDIKQQNGTNLQYNSKKPPSTATTTVTVTAAHQPKVTPRRRCRSECLQVSPIPSIPVSNSRRSHHNHYLRSKADSPSFVVESCGLQKRMLPVPNELPQTNTKENLMLNGHIHRPEITDLRDVYLNDMDIYRRLRKNGFHPDPPYDIDSRKLRARSESEPHEIYTNKPAVSKICTLKRTRETISPTDEQNLVIPNSIKESPPSKISNSVAGENAVRKAANKAAVIVVNGFRNGKTLKVGKYRPGSATKVSLGRKSVSPVSFVSTSPTPSTLTESTQDTQDLDDDEAAGDECADDEGEGDDDLDEDADDNDEALEESITDSEDNYNSNTPTSISCQSPIGCVVGGYVKQGPLAPSLFPLVPPYITFATHDEKGPPMPPTIQKCLKWKLTLITPIIVRKVLMNSGFRLLKRDPVHDRRQFSDPETNDWVGIWGKHMKSTCFKTLKPYQKFNHLPGSFQIGRKDRLWRNLQSLIAKHGKKEFGFMPKTYILPQDLKLLRNMWTKYSQRGCKWIIKPPASARGTGIKVINKWAQIPKRKPLIVQRYIERPLLINGSKFDLRLYVLVTSTNPLRVYMHTDGLARFASVQYSEKADTLNDRYMHLTNYSINKLSTSYNQNEDADACQGHKWTIKSLWTHFRERGVDVDRLWAALRNLALKTILAGEGPVNILTKVNVGSRYNCYELFGIDVLLDAELVPWLLEVNISPSLHSASSLDSHVKGPLVQAIFNTALYQIPPKIPLAEQKELIKELGFRAPLCFDKRIYVTGLSKYERQKHNEFIQKDMKRDEYIEDILDELTPDDVRCLLLAEDELARSAPLERILPAPNSHKYLQFTENPRYYNRLLDAWEARYSKHRHEGISLLQSLCERRVHLQVPPTTIKKDCNDKLIESTKSNTIEPPNATQQLQTDTPNPIETPNAPQNQPGHDYMDTLFARDSIESPETALNRQRQPIQEVIVKAPANNRNGLTLNDSSHLLAEAILLKTQECGETENNAIIVQTD